MESKEQPERNRFLIVEDDPNDAFFIRRVLGTSSRCGRAAVCRNPSEAKAMLKGAGMYADRSVYPVPNVILTDLRMGDETGIDLVEWLRQQETPLKEIPIIILTGSSTPVQFAAAQKAGANGVYRKPTRLEDLQELLVKIAEEFCPKGR